MTLVSSGALSMSNIKVELGGTAGTVIDLYGAEVSGTYGTINTNSTSKPDKATPCSISEWYGYNHTAAPPTPQFITFNGTNQYALSGDVNWIKSYTTATSFSIAMWVKPATNATSTVKYWFHSRNSGSTSFFDNNIFIRHSPSFGIQFGLGGQTSQNVTTLNSSAALPGTFNLWYHYVVTYNGTTKAAIIYRNGSSVDSGTLSSSVTFNTSSARNIAFGGVAGSTAGNYTDVSIDEVGFFNKVLSSTEVTTIYNSRSPYSLTGFSGLVENWKFDGSGTSSTGTANVTLYNTPTYTNTPTTY